VTKTPEAEAGSGACGPAGGQHHGRRLAAQRAVAEEEKETANGD